MKTKEEIKQAEVCYQIAQENWYETKEKKYRDEMFFLIQDCCSNIMKSKLKGITVSDFDGKVLDATMDILSGLDKKQRKIDKLSSYCYNYCRHVLYKKSDQFHDRMISYDAWAEFEYNDE